MILYEISGQSENAPAYRDMEVANVDRLHRFLESAVQASITAKRLQLSQTVIKAFNYHAIACLHAYAGEYRPCEVSVGEYRPPAHYRVGALMEDFVDRVNRNWEKPIPFKCPLTCYGG